MPNDFTWTQETAAVTTLLQMGYTWTGGAMWRPPESPAPTLASQRPERRREPAVYVNPEMFSLCRGLVIGRRRKGGAFTLPLYTDPESDK